MKPVGTRSISLLFLLLVLVAVAAVSGLFRSSTLEAITPEVAVCLGVFTVLAGTGLFRFWDLGGPSRSYLRMSYRGPRWEGEQAVLEGKGLALLAGPAGREPPREIPALVSRVLAQAACLLVALMCFNKRTVALMFETPGELASAGSQVCPVEIPEEKPVQVEKPGCELIIRAHALGYVKDLGTCAPSEEEKKIELCHLRQHDEPYLHYSARLLAHFVRQVRLGIGGPGFVDRVRTTFETQLAHREPLIGRQKSVVASAPKASHHIFTNLPYPEGRVRHWLREAFEPNGCFTRFRQLAHMTPESQPSRVLEHVYGHLLFNSRYDEAVGDCKEYRIHWDSPVDACEKLAASPEKFLTGTGTLEPVRSVLERLKQRREIEKLEARLVAINGLVGPVQMVLKPKVDEEGKVRARAPAEPGTVVSFQCFMMTEGRHSAESFSFDLFGERFAASAVHFPGVDARKVHVELYKGFSSAMAEGFQYTGYLSRSSSSAASGSGIAPESLSSPDFRLTRLEYLKSTDLFLGSDWIQSRDDLLEVYPYYHHLYHFVQLFRQKYRLQRTQL